MKNVCFAIVLLLAQAAAAEPPTSTQSMGRIVVVDPAFERLVAPDAVVEEVADGLHWVEGPVWDRAAGALLFSDIPANAIMQWKPGEGASVYFQPSGYTGREKFEGPEPGSNGLTLDPEGRLILAEHGDRRVSRLEKDRMKTTLADRYRGKRLNSPNDVAFRPGGDLYFTDPPYGLPQRFDDPARELDFTGVFRIAKSGEAVLVIRDLSAPNGLTFSPDGKTLYVSNSDKQKPVWMAYDVSGDGSVSNGRLFADATPFMGRVEGAPDGLKTDRHGNLFASGPGGIYVFSPQGRHLGTIETGIKTSNCNWGDDGSTLYITASTAIYRVRTRTRGAGW